MFTTSQPTLAGFTQWVYTIMGVPQEAMPSTSPFLAYAFNVAMATVNQQLACAPAPTYLLAVYNLGGDRLVNYAPDQAGVLYPDDNPNDLGYFAYLRKQWNLTGPAPGFINSSADEGTSSSYTVPKQLEELTLGDLQNLKTPWGREYLSLAQSVGNLWGIT